MTELRPALLVIAAVAGLLAVVDLGLALEVTDGVATAVHILVPIVGLELRRGRPGGVVAATEQSQRPADDGDGVGLALSPVSSRRPRRWPSQSA